MARVRFILASLVVIVLFLAPALVTLADGIRGG
jgi:hypothetical protein